MMRNILVPLSSGFDDEPALEAALLIARRMNSHIRALYVRPDPAAAIGYIPDVIAAAAVTYEIIERESLEVARAERTRFEAWAQHHDLTTSPPAARRYDCRCATWADHAGDIEKVVTRFGRVSDLIVMSRYEPGDIMAARCFDAAVFGSGRPTLITPKHLPCGGILEHVLVAWNGSLEASHAVFGALPLLQAAGKVSVFTMPEAGRGNCDSLELREALLWNGISANDIGRPQEPCSSGTALLAMASGVSLLVMGAYTHSRLRQSFLGGATRQVLAEATMPVLMCH